jgi:hypothetical protein
VTQHFHGTPISPLSVLNTLAGRNFCISYAAPQQVSIAHEIGQSCMLDNGAFSVWSRGHTLDVDGFMDWAEPWLEYPTTWAVIPDVIGGSEEDNDRLLVRWFQRRMPKGGAVWHMHESLERLKRLCHGYERVCIGSSAQYAQVGSSHWHRRMETAFNAICGSGPVGTWLHMLRGMSLAGSHYPFASLDSTDIARNHNRDCNTAREMADRWDALQCPARWEYREQLELAA